VLKQRDFPYSKIKMLASARCYDLIFGHPDSAVAVRQTTKGKLRHCAIIQWRLVAAYRSAGKKVDFDGEEHTIEELTEDRCQMSKHQKSPIPYCPACSRLFPVLPGIKMLMAFKVPHCSFGDVQLALFSAGGSITKKFAPACEKAGCTVNT
jgi:aspartate-semialdehyde dehydrogenase